MQQYLHKLCNHFCCILKNKKIISKVEWQMDSSAIFGQFQKWLLSLSTLDMKRIESDAKSVNAPSPVSGLRRDAREFCLLRHNARNKHTIVDASVHHLRPVRRDARAFCQHLCQNTRVVTLACFISCDAGTGSAVLVTADDITIYTCTLILLYIVYHMLTIPVMFQYFYVGKTESFYN